MPTTILLVLDALAINEIIVSEKYFFSLACK